MVVVVVVFHTVPPAGQRKNIRNFIRNVVYFSFAFRCRPSRTDDAPRESLERTNRQSFQPKLKSAGVEICISNTAVFP